MFATISLSKSLDFAVSSFLCMIIGLRSRVIWKMMRHFWKFLDVFYFDFCIGFPASLLLMMSFVLRATAQG